MLRDISILSLLNSPWRTTTLFDQVIIKGSHDIHTYLPKANRKYTLSFDCIHLKSSVVFLG
jgi:hypothetical protein